MTNEGQGDAASRSLSFSETVQDSRKGERFHHVWAAIQALKLLDARSGLRSIWIEGAAGDPVPGDEIIDIAEYYGADGAVVEKVIVRQLKYSTKRASINLGLRDVRNTMVKFALMETRLYEALKVPQEADISYSLVSNRPVGVTLQRAMQRIVNELPARPGSTHHKLLLILGPDSYRSARIAKRISFDSDSTGLSALRSSLAVMTANLAGTTDPGIPAMLVEAISARASGEISDGMRLADVAIAFRVTEAELVPAPSMLTEPTASLQRACYADLATRVLVGSQPTLITAVGGAGKSTFAAQLPSLLAGRAEVVVYDCFGNGEYRAANHPRHRHRDGLVQISSELAARGLCSPLIPARSMEPAEFMKAFVTRLAEASARLSAAGDDHLVLLIDAADNAASAADAHAGERTFVRDFWRLDLPSNVHVALTARPHRITLLDPPAGVQPIALPEFSLDESGAMLRTRHPDATPRDAEEFHRQTSGNPRIQALALEVGETLEDCLRSLGEAAAGIGDALDNLLATRLDSLLDEAGQDRGRLEHTGRLLATLRPRIPLSALASLTGGTTDLIRSFVSDLGRGLLISEDAVQFLDEPTETYFRERYRIDSSDANQLVEQLTTSSLTNAYIAASLPQVLWEAKRYDELMALGRSDSVLVEASEVENRQIAQLRTGFALLAAFKLQRMPDIVELAMLAGRAAASGKRRYALLRDAADLTGEFIDSAALDELRAARLLPSEWPGAVLGSEALMLAFSPNRTGEARSRLRASVDATLAFVRAPRDRGSADIEPNQTAHIAIAKVMLEDAAAGAEFVERWKPRRWVLDTAGRVTATLLRRGQAEEVREFAVAARTAALAIGVAAEQQRLGQRIGQDQAEVAWRLLRGKTVEFDIDDFNHRRLADSVLRGVTWIAAAAVHAGIATPSKAATLLTRYLPNTPPSDIGSEHGRPGTGLLQAYALRELLSGTTLTPEMLVPLPPIPLPPAKRPRDSRADDRARLKSVLPWLRQWARWALGETDDRTALALVKTYPTGTFSNGDKWFLRSVAGAITAQLGTEFASAEVVAEVNSIVSTAADHSGLYIATEMVECLRGDSRYADAAYMCLDAVSQAVTAEKQTADQTIEVLVALARAAYAYDPEEARGYFSQAVGVASRVGDDAWDRWRSVLALAKHSGANDASVAFALAAHTGRTAEALGPYLDDGFDHGQLVGAIGHLAGPRALALLSQWRDRRFGSLEYIVYSLVEETEVFEETPHLAMSMSVFSERISLGAHLAAADARQELNPERFESARNLAWVRGRRLDPATLGPKLATEYGIAEHRDPIPLEPIQSSEIFDDPKFRRERKQSEDQARVKLAQLDLTGRAGMNDAAVLVEEFLGTEGIAALVQELAKRPAHTWASVVRAFWACERFTPWQQGEFLNAIGSLSSKSRAFQQEVRNSASAFVAVYATDIVTGQAYPTKIESLATLLDIAPRNLLLRALEAADPSSIVDSSDACYKLALKLTNYITQSESAKALSAALHSIDQDLELDAWNTESVRLPNESTATSATAAFLWVALADPRTDVRWRAIHAIRFLLEYGAPEFVRLLADVASASEPDGYTELSFPFYRMHAVEGLLVAIERATVSDRTSGAQLLSVVDDMRREFPDHLRIQTLCAHIGDLLGDATLVAAARIDLQVPKILPWSKIPHAPKPFQRNAPTSEVRFNFEIDEHWLGPLSVAFGRDHADTLREISDVILDEWGWRDSSELETDPRRLVVVYESGETHSHRGEWPKSDDLEFYLTYHAMMTAAGRLARREAPLQVRGHDRLAFVDWWCEFTPERRDGYWISDARRPTPEGLGHSASTNSADWRWNFTGSQFERAFLGDDGWITLQESAENVMYGGYETIAISSALVGLEAATALMAALQTAPTFLDRPLAFSGDADGEDGELKTGPYLLRGWISNETTRRPGADRRDPFAANVVYPTPGPASWITELLQLRVSPGGRDWSKLDARPVVSSEAWATKDGSRNPLGQAGTRLRVSPDFLADLAQKTGNGVVVEVRLDRRLDSSSYSYSDDDDDLRYLDGYVRYFLFTAGSGWQDYRGRVVSR